MTFHAPTKGSSSIELPFDQQVNEYVGGPQYPVMEISFKAE